MHGAVKPPSPRYSLRLFLIEVEVIFPLHPFAHKHHPSPPFLALRGHVLFDFGITSLTLAYSGSLVPPHKGCLAQLCLFHSRVAAPQVCHRLYGRVLKGRGPADFTSLSNDGNRRIVFVTDEDGLRQMVGKTGYQMLVAIGWTPAYIQEMAIDAGFSFKLVLFGPSRQVRGGDEREPVNFKILKISLYHFVSTL